jgi:predicted nuclease of predicted toxin-antitoxin system
VSDRIRYHLDEHIDPEITDGLRRYGFDVTTTVQVALRRAKDPTQIAFVRSQKRVIVTDDAHLIAFGRSTTDRPGIVVPLARKHSTREIIAGLTLIYEALTPEEMAGRVEYI